MRLHDFERGACDPEGASQGDANDFVPLFVGHVDNFFAGAQARVVDQNVNAAHGLVGLVNQGLNLSLLADIAQLAVNGL